MLKVFLFFGEESMDLLLLSWNNFVIMFFKNFEKLAKISGSFVITICSRLELFLLCWNNFAILLSKNYYKLLKGFIVIADGKNGLFPLDFMTLWSDLYPSN